MTTIKPVSETSNTVTLRRSDYDDLLRTVEDVADIAAVEAHRAFEARVGWGHARQAYLSVDEAERLLDGESPIRVWRLKRGIKQRTLAEAAGMAVSYLAEIEAGKKQGSPETLRRIAATLEVSLEPLLGVVEDGFKPISAASMALQRLEDVASRDRMAKDAHAIVAELRKSAARQNAGHQVNAAIEALALPVKEKLELALRDARKAEVDGDAAAETRSRDKARGWGAVLDSLVDLRNGH